MNTDVLRAKGLNYADIAKIRSFCSLPRELKEEIIYEKLKMAFHITKSKCSTISTSKRVVINLQQSSVCPSLGRCSNGVDTYSCGIANGIPCPKVLGISTCIVIEMSTECCIPGEIDCLWGCENADPKLGFGHDGRYFESIDEFRSYVESKGYYESIFSYPERGIYDFTRDIGYGYRYEAWYVEDRHRGYSEGPEPNPDPNWYGFIHGFWPIYTYGWHQSC